jgi:hypothetical protein
MAILPTFATILSILSAVGFTLVGRSIQKRDVSARMRIGQDAFVVWWYALAFTTVLGAVGNLLALSFGPYLLLTVLALFVLCVGLCGLLFYLVFLFTERRGLLLPMIVGYAGFFIFLLWFILAGQPDGLERTAWGTTLHYADPIDHGPAFVAAIVLLLGPQVTASIGYLSLYWKVDDPMLRRRILLVSLSILAWFGSSLIGTGVDAAETDWWNLTSRLIGLAAAGTIYYAYTGIRPSTPQSAPPATKPDDDGLYESPPRRGVTHVLPMGMQALA